MIKLLVILVWYENGMSKHFKVRPFLWSAIFFALIGAVLGGFMAIRSVDSLSQASSKMGVFERAWSNANLQDARASDAARYYIHTLDNETYEKFQALNSGRTNALMDAIDSAPKMQNQKILNRTYEATMSMADIESGAVSLAKSGEPAAAIAMLNNSRYSQLGSTKSVLKETARGESVNSINGEIEYSYDLLLLGLGALIVSLSVAAYCWWKVGIIFQLQARELEVARDSLAAHANQLEEKIEIRTRDLESAKIAAEAADKAKSAFLAQMSHEIRTPLNGVLGMAAAIANTSLDERQKRLVSVIQESGDTLLALLNDVLDLAKIESGKLEIETIDFSVSAIIRSAEAIFSTRAHEKGLSFSVSIDEVADNWCIGDPTRLRQIIYNLMSNAIKFTNEGDIKVRASGEKIGEGEIALCFEVEDSGIGIDENGIARLFQKFSQADSATTRKFGGTGLGLAISKQLANLMGGDIVVKSALGVGSIFTFTVRVPIGQAPAQTDAQTFNEALAIDGEDAKVLRILAAEDNANNRLVLKMFLEQVGVTPTFVENGALAVEAWKTADFDVILMDVQMPIMSGPEASSEIRKLERKTNRARTPIIALTANAMTHHVRECLLAGMDAHVAKPIQPDLLFATIDEVLTRDEQEFGHDISIEG